MATVLCIDDDPRILELQDAVLSSSGYTVLTALDGFTGLALTRSHSIDAIVLDCNMTGMDGSAVTQELMKEHPKLPVVVCSSCPNDVPDCQKWYADALLQKTDGPEALLSAIQELLSTSSPRAGKTLRISERLAA